MSISVLLGKPQASSIGRFFAFEVDLISGLGS